MGNCLVSKLKSPVQNENLEKLGRFTAIITPGVSCQFGSTGGTVDVTTSNNNSVTCTDFSLAPQTLPLENIHNNYIISTNTNGVEIIFDDYYKIGRFAQFGGFDVTKIKNMTELTYLRFDNASIVFNDSVSIEDLPASLTQCEIVVLPLKGLISDLKAVNLNIFYFGGNENIGGRLEDFVEKCCVSRTSGGIDMRQRLGANMTFNNVAYSGSGYYFYYIAFSATGAKVYNAQSADENYLLGTYNKSTNTWTYGPN